MTKAAPSTNGRLKYWPVVRRAVQFAALVTFLILFLYACWPYGCGSFAESLVKHELIDAELFLKLDPLIGVSSSLASRSAGMALAWAMATLALCIIVPRWFCGYLCPMGTLIDGFDWLIGRRVTKLHIKTPSAWLTSLRYAVLATVIIGAAFGVLASGAVSAMAVLTRGLVMSLGPAQQGLMRESYIAPPVTVGHYISLAIFAGAFAMSLFGRRFWCRFICPTGALLSLASLVRVASRRVNHKCIQCGKCVKVCSFDAVNANFSTRNLSCTTCGDCFAACPTGAIEYSHRWADTQGEVEAIPVAGEITRRAFLYGTASAATISAALLTGTSSLIGPTSDETDMPVRPPGATPEDIFLRQCVGCGLCIKACPSDVLQPIGFGRGLENLWTPHANCDWAGCEKECNNCGQVCPTGAIRPLPLIEKQAARMGRAIINEHTCLPHASLSECDYCVRVCPHGAMEYIWLNVELDEEGMPIQDSGFRAPVVLEDKCVGCGQCQAACYHENVRTRYLLNEAAISVHAGNALDDRIRSGSYIQLHKPADSPTSDSQDNDTYLPDFL